MNRWKTIGALGAFAALTLTGCSSGDDKNYAVPDELCGVPAKPDLIKELLPNGDKLKVNKAQSKTDAPVQFCTLIVDDNIEVSINGEWQPAGTTAKQAAAKSLSHNLRSAEGGRFALWDDEAFTVFDCKNTEYKAGRFSLNVALSHPDGDMSEKIQRFLDPFSKAYAKTLPCES